MTEEELRLIKFVVDIGSTVSGTAVLALVAWAFYRGDIISRVTLERIVAMTVTQVIAEMDKRFENLKEELRDAVKENRGGLWK